MDSYRSPCLIGKKSFRPYFESSRIDRNLSQWSEMQVISEKIPTHILVVKLIRNSDKIAQYRPEIITAQNIDEICEMKCLRKS